MQKHRNHISDIFKTINVFKILVFNKKNINGDAFQSTEKTEKRPESVYICSQIFYNKYTATYYRALNWRSTETKARH